MDKWQPIETAPKDGSYILVQVVATADAIRWPGRCFVARHEGLVDTYDLGWSLFPGFGGIADETLAYWMPLPKAPDHGETNG